MILKAYKYRIYPNHEQKVLINKHFGCARFVYNWGLETKTKIYKESQKSVSCIDLINNLVNLKKEHEWLKEVNSQALQATLRNLDNAYTRFFRERKGFPKFKNKHGKQSFQCPQQNKVDFENNTISLIKFKNIKAVLHRKFTGIIKTVTVSKTPTNKYFAAILVETPDELATKPKLNKKKAIGVDLGLKHFITLSTGEKVDNPRHLQKSSKKITFLARHKDRKQKGSKRREKSSKRLAIIHEKVKNQFVDFLHKLSTRLIRENQSICLEDLNVAGMVKNHCLAKSISSAAWSSFVEMLKYKGEWYGRNIIQIGRFDPSSKLCDCGKINNGLKLSDRLWTCLHCEKTHDRDILAAKNILDFAFHKQNLIQHRVGHTRINAQGDGKVAEQKCSVVV